MKKTDPQKSAARLSQELKDKFRLYAIPEAEDYAQLVNIAAKAKTCAGHFSNDGEPGAGLSQQDDGRLAVSQGLGVVSTEENGVSLAIGEESRLYFDDEGALAVNPKHKLSVVFFEGLTSEERVKLFYWFSDAYTMELSENQLPLDSFIGKNTLGHSLCFNQDGSRLFISGYGPSIQSMVFSRNNKLWTETYTAPAIHRGAPNSPVASNGSGNLYCRGFDAHPNNDGSIGIYKENNTAWDIRYLLAPAGQQWHFGRDIAISKSDLLVVGAPQWSENTAKYGAIVLITELPISPESVILPEQYQLLVLSSPEAGDGFGHSVAVNSDGTILVGGAPGRNSKTGEVTIYRHHGEQWVPYPPLVPDVPGGEFGTSLSLNAAGDKLAVGSPKEAGSRGAVYVYRRCNDTWELITKLTGDAEAGEQFGYRVALSSDGGTLAVSSPEGKNGSGVKTGAAWWFGADLERHQRMLADDGAAGHKFGAAIALGNGGNILAVGAPGVSTTGKVYLYE